MDKTQEIEEEIDSIITFLTLEGFNLEVFNVKKSKVISLVKDNTRYKFNVNYNVNGEIYLIWIDVVNKTTMLSSSDVRDKDPMLVLKMFKIML